MRVESSGGGGGEIDGLCYGQNFTHATKKKKINTNKIKNEFLKFFPRKQRLSGNSPDLNPDEYFGAIMKERI